MYVPFSGIKKVLRQKTLSFFGKKLPNKILKVHVKKIAKTKGQLKPAKFLTTKNCLSSWSKVTDAKSLTDKNAKRKTDCGFELRATRI